MMRSITVTSLCASALLFTGCSKQDAASSAPDSTSVAAQEQTGNQVAENMARVQGNTGGKFKLNLSGALTGSADSQDAGFCAQKAAVMAIFAVSLVDSKYGLEIGSAKGLPSPGTYKFSPDALNDWSGMLLDKTTGGTADKWGKYEIQSGSVTVTGSTPERVSGTFTFSATPKEGSGAGVNGSGEFEASRATQCTG